MRPHVPKNMRYRKQITCTCDAYPFPHRLGGGECNPDHIDLGSPGFRRRTDADMDNAAMDHQLAVALNRENSHFKPRFHGGY